MFSFYFIMIYMFLMIVNDLLTNVKFIALCHDHLSKAQRKEVWTTVGHVKNPETMNEEFMMHPKLLDRLNYESKVKTMEG
jgi:hypothetical protein